MKLAGVKVIELSLFLPGPHLAMMMADHGADVTKVEPYDGGEPNRHIGPEEDGETVYFCSEGCRATYIERNAAAH